MNLSEIERTLGKSRVDALLGGVDPREAIAQETEHTDPRRMPKSYAALVALHALVSPRVWSRKYDGE